MNILFIGAHPDDIELSCAGSIMRFVKQEDNVFCFVLTSGKNGGDKELRAKEQHVSWKKMGVDGIISGFKDGDLVHSIRLIDAIDEIINDFDPHYIFTHCPEDTHQDHIAVSKATRSACRKGADLIYYPSHNVDNFNANFFVDIEKYIFKKLNVLSMFKTQQDKWYFGKDYLMSVAGSVGHKRYAEKFRIERMSL